jgi:hypothetical protein
MFRKLLPSVLLLLLVGIVALLGCSKKPSDPEIPVNYAPQGMTAFPDIDKVVVKWTRNSEAESQSGFGGYVVYCTSRRILDASDNDSIVGLTLLTEDSLQYFQVPGCPTLGDSAVVTVDPTDGKALKQGTKYYFYVRSIVDGQLSWAGNWVWSSPRPIGYGTIYAFTPYTVPGAVGDSSNFQFGATPKLYATPLIKWRIKYSDVTYYYPDTLLINARITYSKHFVADTSLRTTDSLLADTSVCGYVEWDSLPVAFKTVWKDNKDTSLGKAYDLLVEKKGSDAYVAPLLNSIDLVLEKVPGNPSQVRLTSPTTVTNIPVAAAWNKGRETQIQSMPAGYGASVPDVFQTGAYSVLLNLGETGNVYQIKTANSNYAKMQIDSVVTSGNTIKVCFRYAYQMAAGIRNF